MMAMGMGRAARKSVLALAAVAMLAGCADQKGNLTAQGAGLGALTGAVIGGLVGGDAKGALIGAAAGAALGGAAGYGLGSQQESFASAEQELQARTDRARAIAANQRNEAEAARVAAARYERSLAPLRQQVSTGRGISQQQRNTLRQAQAERDEMRDKVAGGDQAVNEIRASIASLRQKGQNTSALEAEARSIEQSTARLRSSLDRMNASLGNIEA